MKNSTLIVALAITMFSCNSTKNMNASNISTTENAQNLLSTLNADSSFQQIYTLFTLLDVNNDEAISSIEAVDTLGENFTVLDTDRNSDLNFNELKGLLVLLE